MFDQPVENIQYFPPEGQDSAFIWYVSSFAPSLGALIPVICPEGGWIICSSSTPSRCCPRGGALYHAGRGRPGCLTKARLVLTSREFRRHPVRSCQRRSPHLRRLMFLPWICPRSSEQLKSKGCDFGKTVRSHRLSLGAGVIRKYGALVSHARRRASALTAREGRRTAPAPLPTACRA